MSAQFTEDIYPQDRIDRVHHRQSHQRWIEDLATKAREPRDVLHEALGLALTPILSFIADGAVSGTIGERAWVLLLCVRPDLLSGQTRQQAIRQYGFATAAITRAEGEFRRAFPGLVIMANSRAWTAEHKANWNQSRADKIAGRRSDRQKGVA